MTMDFEERLWGQLEAAAEREGGRGRVRRGAAMTRATLRVRVGRAAGAAVAVLAAALAIVVGLHPQPTDRSGWRVEQFRVAGSDLAAGATGFGSLWTYDTRSAAVLRVDPRTRRVLARLPLPTELPSVAVATGAGAVWAVPVEPPSHGAPPSNPSRVSLVRIDPRSNRVSARIALRAGDRSTIHPIDLVTRPGVVWVWGQTGAQRVDPARNRVTAVVKVPGASIRGFVATDAAVSALTDVGRLVSFDARSGARLSATSVPVAQAYAQKLVAIDDGVVVDLQNGSIASIDPTTGRIRWTAHGTGGLRDLTATSGRLWILLSASGHDQLRALDPATGRTMARITLPAEDVSAISAVGDRILATTGQGAVITVRPR